MDSLIPLVTAAALSGLIGAEREAEGKAAGFRTHLLIGIGAALISLLSVQVAEGAAFTLSDPGRIAAQIVSGIGFVGAGAIIQSRASVKGITTAATLWVSAAIGMACAFDQYIPAIIVTLVALFSLRVLGQLDRLFRSRPRWHTLEITSMRGRDALEALLESQFSPSRWEIERAFVSESQYGVVVRVRARAREVTAMIGRLYDQGEGIVAEVRLG